MFAHDSWMFAYVIIPLLIVLARIMDVTIGTMRIIFVSRGMKRISATLGFFEVLIWLLAIGQVFANLTNFMNYIAYAAGFAAGNYIGIIIEEKIAVGAAVVRIITQRDPALLVDALRAAGYGVTLIDALGKDGPCKVVFTIVWRRNIQDVIEKTQKYNPRAFYSIEDVRYAAKGAFEQIPNLPLKRRLFNYFRKGK